jgi:hypothetical protein
MTEQKEIERQIARRVAIGNLMVPSPAEQHRQLYQVGALIYNHHPSILLVVARKGRSINGYQTLICPSTTRDPQ